MTACAEVLQQRDLLFGVGADLLPIDANDSDELGILAHGDRKASAHGQFIDKETSPRMRQVQLTVGGQVGGMDQVLAGNVPSEQAALLRYLRLPQIDRVPNGARSVHRSQVKAFAVIREQGAKRRLAKTLGLCEDRVEHRGEVAGRGIDDLQYLSGRSLLFECLARLGQEPRIFHRNDRLRCEVLQ